MSSLKNDVFSFVFNSLFIVFLGKLNIKDKRQLQGGSIARTSLKFFFNFHYQQNKNNICENERGVT